MPKTSHVLLTLIATVACSVAAIDDKLLEKAEQGDPESQFNVGVCYSFGEGTLKLQTKQTEYDRILTAYITKQHRPQQGFMLEPLKGIMK